MQRSKEFGLAQKVVFFSIIWIYGEEEYTYDFADSTKLNRFLRICVSILNNQAVVKNIIYTHLVENTYDEMR